MSDTPTATRRGPANSLRAFAVVAAVVVVGAISLEASRAAFGDTTTNGASTITAGSVGVTDDDAGSVLFNVPAAVPGTPMTRCINVTYNGTSTADIRLYGTIGGTGLAPYLDTTIEVGTGATGGSGFSCAGFSSSSTLHNDDLEAFGATNVDYASGLGGFTGATNGNARSYRIVMEVQDDDAAQGLSATATFVWEAQNA